MTNDDQQEQQRRACLERILASGAPRKLIVAGPGTGKSFTFKQVLQHKEGPNLALTFINALAEDLRRGLDKLAHTYTFHGFCRWLLHTTATAGITTNVDYYPPLTLLQADDLTYLRQELVTEEDLQRDFHLLDASTGTIEDSLRSGDYYNAVGHLDSVYRVLRHFEAHPQTIPQYAQVVVDEYQDFSLLEAEFIAALARQSSTLVVGDDDQALYGFKHASADFIRQLAADPNYERFELPYCTRCTEVLVQATHTVIDRARKAGLLQGRLDKRYECYLPEKRRDSDRYPHITHAECSVQRTNAPYMARYIHRRILEIPSEEIAESHEDGYPTALVTGPSQFTAPIFEYLSQYFSIVEHKRAPASPISPLDGYRRLAVDPRSRLGWRILLQVDPPAGLPAILRTTLTEGAELGEVLPDAYHGTHLPIADLVRRLLADEILSPEDVVRLEESLRVPFPVIRAELMPDESDPTTGEPSQANPKEPHIVVTSLVGAKGLQAGHVFVAGFNDGHFPRSNTEVQDYEVCCLLVALTRAKKSCTLISCTRFGQQRLGRSLFLKWLDPHLAYEYVDANYFRD